MALCRGVEPNIGFGCERNRADPGGIWAQNGGLCPFERARRWPVAFLLRIVRYRLPSGLAVGRWKASSGCARSSTPGSPPPAWPTPSLGAEIGPSLAHDELERSAGCAICVLALIVCLLRFIVSALRRRGCPMDR